MKTLKSIKFWLVVLLVVTIVATVNTTILIDRLMTKTEQEDRDTSGYEAFAKVLSLSDSQLQELNQIVEKERESLKQIYRKIQASMKPHYEETKENTYKALEALLTPEQKAKWEEMKKAKLEGD